MNKTGGIKLFTSFSEEKDNIFPENTTMVHEQKEKKIHLFYALVIISGVAKTILNSMYLLFTNMCIEKRFLWFVNVSLSS